MEVEDGQLDRMAYASVTTDFCLLEKKEETRNPLLLWLGLILKGWPPKHCSILEKFLQIYILSNTTLQSREYMDFHEWYVVFWTQYPEVEWQQKEGPVGTEWV